MFRSFISLFLILIVGLATWSQNPPSSIIIPPDVLTSQAVAAQALMNYKAWNDAEHAAHDAAITQLQTRAPIPGPQGLQGIQGVPGNPSNTIGILVYPAMLVYNPQNINTTSLPQFVMVSNQSSLPIPLAPSSISGPFQLGGGGNCGGFTSIPAGQNCVYGIQFKTSSIGAKIGFITINVGGLQLSVNLEGMGQ